MVSRKRPVLEIRGAFCVVAVAFAGVLVQPASGQGPAKKFYADDPLWREPAPRNVQNVAARKVDDIYDFVENSYVTPGRERKDAKQGLHLALDVNTLGEVPDSAWYTNRHWIHRMSIAELRRGPGNATPPNPKDSWQIVGAKSDGVTPGFVIEDQHKNRYLLKFDPPRYPELSSAADVIGSKFFYALGYETPENYVVHFRRENLAISSGVTWRDGSGRKHPLTPHALDDMLKAQSKGPDGTYRALASRWITGKLVGPFSYYGARTDDANDTLPHQDRRVLRGLAVFCAWLGHHDTRSINTMDTLVTKDGRQYVQHYLLDFGSILGSAGDRPKEPWIGHEYFIARRGAAVQIVTLGLYPPRWIRADYPQFTGVGLFDADSFEPLAWKSNYPNPAFLMMDREDAFWAAKQVAAFTDDEIRAIVNTGEFSDPRATDWIVHSLIKRRDKITQAWFSQILPLDGFRIVDGKLAFDDLSAVRGIDASSRYDVRWSNYDNDRGHLTALPNSIGTSVPHADSGTNYLAATIACKTFAPGACAKSITVYLRRAATAFDVVGVDR